MSSLDRMLGWFPHTTTEWIELIIVTVLLWLLMMAIFELSWFRCQISGGRT